MKNLDIENLERKNIFKTPESFLEKMQSKVLQEISSTQGFDIEKLERKEIFKTPNGFFEEMQANVLQKVQPIQAKKEGRMVKMNWVYAAAAAITMFFGITFFVNQDKVTDPAYVTENNIANNENASVINTQSVIKPQADVLVSKQNVEKNLTSATQVNHRVSTKPMSVAAINVEKVSTKKTVTVQQNPEVQVDQVLSSFTSAELADLGTNAERDIYLDLYN